MSLTSPCFLTGAGGIADTAIDQGAERHIHQLEQGVEQPLSRSQSQVENTLDHQEDEMAWLV